MITTNALSEHIGEAFKTLIDAHGPIDEFASIKVLLEKISPDIRCYLEELQQIITQVKRKVTNVSLNFDLSELRGYHYHTGMVFTAYTPRHGQGIAFGGRYDGVGKAFGYARPATGFSADITTLFALSTLTDAVRPGIWAPYNDDPAQIEAIKQLRGEGEIVVGELPNQNGSPREMECDRQLEYQAGKWTVATLGTEIFNG